jgi:hypothetical protein
VEPQELVDLRALAALGGLVAMSEPTNSAMLVKPITRR